MGLTRCYKTEVFLHLLILTSIPFQVIAVQTIGQFLFAFDRGYLSLTISFGWIQKFTTTKFYLKKIETSLYCIAENVFRYAELLDVGHECDGQTDELTEQPLPTRA